MEQSNNITKNKKGKHLNYEDRLKIEILIKAGKKSEEIGKFLGGRSGRTVCREINKETARLINSDLTERKKYSRKTTNCKVMYRLWRNDADCCHNQ